MGLSPDGERVFRDFQCHARHGGTQAPSWRAAEGRIRPDREGGALFCRGDVPAEDIKQLLLDKPRARGLAVPGLPLGAPGFEGGDPTCEAGCTIVDAGSSERESQRELYDTLLVAPNGKTSVYARH
ncbi:MAG: DUF411 domain-containing protein [Sulfuricella sp.]